MAIPKTPNQKSQYGKLNKRLAQYVGLVQLLYEKYNKRAAQIAISDGYKGDGEYHFDSVTSKKLIADVQSEFVDELRSLIYGGISQEWKNSNKIQDLLADKVLDFYEVTNKRGERYKKYYQVNGDALKSFQRRRDNGLNLSQKIWKQADEYKTALEDAISTAIQRGNSAATLSKRVSQYLLDFDKMRSDYTERFGKKSKALDCEYKSIRLARSEINMAYRTAEQTRWRQMDFILGYEIKLSKAHKVSDVCDCLAGKYPKDFNWTGWHPNDMCYAVPILMTDEQFWGFDEEGNEVESTPRYVHDVPAGFRHWVESNSDRIKVAESRGTLPYFLRDNKGFYNMRPVGIIKSTLNSISERYEHRISRNGIITPKMERLIKEYEFAYDKASYYPSVNNMNQLERAVRAIENDGSHRFLSIDYRGFESIEEMLREYHAQYNKELPLVGQMYKMLPSDNGYYMATTPHNGDFYFYGDAGNDVVVAMRKIASGNGVFTMKDERALAYLYHEVRHNAVGSYGMLKDGDYIKYVCESVHELISLYDYPRFMENLGYKAVFQDKILREPGYSTVVGALREKMHKYKVREKPFVWRMKQYEDENPVIWIENIADVFIEFGQDGINRNGLIKELTEMFENETRKFNGIGI